MSSFHPGAFAFEVICCFDAICDAFALFLAIMRHRWRHVAILPQIATIPA